ncbi:hypothetical protein ACFL5Z_18775 [Planctomycetota bacterium]
MLSKPMRPKRLLPILAVVGATVFIIAGAISQSGEQGFLTDTGRNRPAIEAVLAKLQTMSPASLDDVDFMSAVKAAQREPHIASLWLFTPDGRCAYSTSPIAARGNVEEWASVDVRGSLDVLSEDALSDVQHTMLLIGSAIRSEWTHNDIYRHMVRAVRKQDGSAVALIGVAYEISGGAHTTLRFYIGAPAALVGLCIYWLSLPLWVFLDARARGRQVWAWTTFVFIGNFVALLAYLLATKSEKDS